MGLDANKDGAVTRAEMDAMTERRFKMTDTNSDGWLSKDELAKSRQGRRGGPGPG
jgi:Ca2+-binding EF-hand superfamily protein